MKKPLRILIISTAAALAIGVGPLLVEWIAVPASQGYYSDGEGHCLCGHRNYYRIEGDVVTSHLFGHNYHVELYGLRKDSEIDYTLLDSDGRSLGSLKHTRKSMIFNLPPLLSEEARVWNRWSIWWQIFWYRNEPLKTDSFKNYKKKPNQAMQRTRMLVTFCAYAQPAPSIRVADL